MSQYSIARFWNRIAAFLIDFILLSITGLTLGLFFHDYFALLGRNGIFIGLLISLIYFSVGNSVKMKGQTLGKYLSNIKVVDSNDNLLSVGKSFLRSSILIFPYFLTNYPIPGISEDSLIGIIKNLLFFTVLFGVVFFYLFNKPDRQSLHDIILKTYVVKNHKETEEIERGTINPGLFYIYYAASLVIIIGMSYFAFNLKNHFFSDLIPLQKKLFQIEEVTNAYVKYNTNIQYEANTKHETQGLICTLEVKQYSLPDKSALGIQNKLIGKAVRLALLNYPKAKELDYITIQISRGYNIGIASSYNTQSINKSPKEWIATLK